ncbi:hypothetical protein NDU88_005379 [Pleurodeles waltl]|uniref:Uncharacterized protein n=1 Tax=Pleurodeles waltl TaxID=8319 RepID=A0AAV7TUM9_PLEWA|nr:hypothetical protein NDU88_005379 [Pleurodeles waltl]
MPYNERVGEEKSGMTKHEGEVERNVHDTPVTRKILTTNDVQEEGRKATRQRTFATIGEYIQQHKPATGCSNVTRDSTEGVPEVDDDVVGNWNVWEDSGENGSVEQWGRNWCLGV